MSIPTPVSPHDDSEKPDHCPVCGSSVVTELIGPAAGSPCPHCGHLLWFTSRRVGGVTVVHLVDTRVAVMELLDLLDNSVDDAALERIVINFGLIQQVSSAALGKLIKLMHRADAVRGKLKLCGLHPDLRHVFRLTRLDRVFEIFETEGEALGSFAAVGG